jgi:hypothetical protein
MCEFDGYWTYVIMNPADAIVVLRGGNPIQMNVA